MNCGNNNSCYDRMNRCSEKPRREMLRYEPVRPSSSRERSAAESVMPSCGCEKSAVESVRPSCGCEKSRSEHTKPSCGYEMPKNERVRPNRSGVAGDREVVESILVVKDTTCQEFMRLYDWFNCTDDKSRREFMGAEKGLKDAMDCIKMGLDYNEKAKEIANCMDEFLDSMNETDSCETKSAYNNRRNHNNCGCNNSCNSMNRCTPKMCDPCMKMREELREMMCNLNEIEEESLECTKAAIDKLKEARELHRCICELKNKVAKNCYPKC